MSSVATYLNFQGKTEEAFNFYKSAFGTEFNGPILRFGDMPSPPGAPVLTDEQKNMILHIELPIVNGHMLMATDMIESLGHVLRVGNNTTINLLLDTKEEADRLYALLSQDSTEFAPMANMPFGQYWGTALDRFGVRWMFSVPL
jgi:PhnB protein